MKNVVLIDDVEEQLNYLAGELRNLLSNEQVDVRTWNPTAQDGDPKKFFDRLVDSDTILVVTDYDLTSKAQTGLFGTTIVGWCQTVLVPVGDYSRGNLKELPEEPDQYAIRVPSASPAVFIAGVYRGFRWFKDAISQEQGVLKKKSPAGVLAMLLSRQVEESRFALYGARLPNAALTQAMNDAAGSSNSEPSSARKAEVLAYVSGHLLLNVILRYPGPILNQRALAAYLAIDAGEVGKVEELFQSAKYTGPFGDIEPYYWLSSVDEILDQISTPRSDDATAETDAELNRLSVEAKLGVPLKRHQCPRCEGKNGGFLCPFTKRVVCQRPDCSVGSSGWIPAGARLSRIERDFYDEWAPLLGF